MPEAWRIVKAKHLTAAFSGAGAAKTGGRWNSRGIPLVYASSSRSLAALETLVHLTPPVTFRYKIIRIEFAKDLVELVKTSSLASDWRTEPPPPSTKRLGDVWVRSSRSAILAVPSVLVPEELNYLLNPDHPDFKKIVVDAAADFLFDPRLLA